MAEEDRNVVADQIPVAFLGILHRKAAHVTRKIGRALVAGHRREAHKDRRLLASTLKHVCTRDVRQGLVGLKEAMYRVAPGMNDAFGESARDQSGIFSRENESR